MSDNNLHCLIFLWYFSEVNLFICIKSSSFILLRNNWLSLNLFHSVKECNTWYSSFFQNKRHDEITQQMKKAWWKLLKINNKIRSKIPRYSFRYYLAGKSQISTSGKYYVTQKTKMILRLRNNGERGPFCQANDMINSSSLMRLFLFIKIRSKRLRNRRHWGNVIWFSIAIEVLCNAKF